MKLINTVQQSKMNSRFTITCILVFIFIALVNMPAKAQLCNGSLGDPVVNITFGSGAMIGQPLKAATTSYTFLAADCPNDGYYTIESRTSNCYNNAWHNLTADHTGDPNGYFMLVNASYQPGAFYLDTVKGLCSGTTYEFAAWVMNLVKSETGIRPNITFTIETPSGTVLQTYNTGEINASAAPQWKQYGFYFTTPLNAPTIVLRMVNNAQGGIGNDVALDDITFRPCGPKLSVQMNGGQTSKDVCQEDKSIFSFNSSITGTYSTPSYQWQVSKNKAVSWTDIAGATGTSYTRLPTDTGAYLYRLAVAEGNNISSLSCRVVSNVITINVQAKPDPKASGNDPACTGDTLRLSASDNGATYAWTGPNGFASTVQNPVINKLSMVNSGKYFVSLTTTLGCSNIDSVEVSLNITPVANAGSDVAICEGTSTTLKGSGGNTFNWSPAISVSDPGNALTVAAPADTTSYILTVSNGICKGYDTVNVFVWKKPIANAGPDQKIYEGNATQLTGLAGGTGVSFYWSPVNNINDNTILNPVVTPTSDNTYTLNVSSTRGCGTATDDVFIRVYKKITIPNVFSPNGDGINDTWNILQLNTYPEARLSIFNRHGQKVYESIGYTSQWNGTFHGKPLPVGTYYYVINLENGLKPFSGWVMILK